MLVRVQIRQSSARLWPQLVTHPRERPEMRSDIIRTPASSPNPSNSLRSQSSSTFQERLPTKRLPDPGVAFASAVFDFLGAEAFSSSALRFLGASLAGSSLSSALSSLLSSLSSLSSGPAIDSGSSSEPPSELALSSELALCSDPSSEESPVGF
jgi:hypothetical protein